MLTVDNSERHGRDKGQYRKWKERRHEGGVESLALLGKKGSEIRRWQQYIRQLTHHTNNRLRELPYKDEIPVDITASEGNGSNPSPSDGVT